MKVFDKGPEHRDTLYDDSPRDLTRVPDLRHGIAPNVPVVMSVHKWCVFPPGSDSSDHSDAGRVSVPPKINSIILSACGVIQLTAFPGLK